MIASAPCLGFSLAGVLLVALGGVACDEGATARGDTEASNEQDVAAAADGSDAVAMEDGAVAPAEEPRCVLTPLGVNSWVGVGSAVQIGAYQHSTDTGEPMPDEWLTFEIVTEASVGGRLSARNVPTDEGGLGAVRLSVGSVAGSIVVRVSSPCARSVDIEVTVTELPTGTLRVGFEYPSRDVGEIGPIEVYVYDTYTDPVRCRDVEPGEVPPYPRYTASAPNDAPDVVGYVVFDGLDVTLEFAVVAIVRGPGGEGAAFGCIDGVFVRADRVTELTVDLAPIGVDAEP